MKSTASEAVAAGIKFPCLLECMGDDGDKGSVVLFTEPRVGTVVHREISGSSMGYHSDSWPMANFKAFHGIITIED